MARGKLTFPCKLLHANIAVEVRSKHLLSSTHLPRCKAPNRDRGWFLDPRITIQQMRPQQQTQMVQSQRGSRAIRMDMVTLPLQNVSLIELL